MTASDDKIAQEQSLARHKRCEARKVVDLGQILVAINNFEIERGKPPAMIFVTDATARALLDQMVLNLAGPDGFPRIESVESLDGGMLFGIRVARAEMEVPWRLSHDSRG